ncbi:hypothetical protein ACNEP5_27965 [Escherichia coli]
MQHLCPPIDKGCYQWSGDWRGFELQTQRNMRAHNDESDGIPCPTYARGSSACVAELESPVATS